MLFRSQQIKQEQASLSTTRYNLSQIVINAPMDGFVTRRNIEEGETAVVGTMNNAGTVQEARSMTTAKVCTLSMAFSQPRRTASSPDCCAGGRGG